MKDYKVIIIDENNNVETQYFRDSREAHLFVETKIAEGKKAKLIEE